MFNILGSTGVEEAKDLRVKQPKRRFSRKVSDYSRPQSGFKEQKKDTWILTKNLCKILKKKKVK